MNKLFDIIDIEDIYNYEITIFTDDINRINEHTLLDKINEIINLVIGKDLKKSDIKYCLYDLQELAGHFNLENIDLDLDNPFLIYIKKTNNIIYF